VLLDTSTSLHSAYQNPINIDAKSSL